MMNVTPRNLSPLNKRGQRLGPKGIATREAIMDAVLVLLRESGLWQVNPSDVASTCSIKQSNFYTYFDSVEEVVLAIANRAANEAPDHGKHAPQDLASNQGIVWVRQIVEATIGEWQKYGPVLRVVEMLADNNIPAFRQARRVRLDALRDILATQIRLAQEAGFLHPELHTRFVVYSVLSLIRVAAEHYKLSREYPMSHEDIVHSTTHMAHLLLTGRTHPDVRSVSASMSPNKEKTRDRKKNRNVAAATRHPELAVRGDSL